MNDTKKLIIEKSLTLFMKRGFKGVSLQDITNETGLSRGIFYYYFTSKEECFEECVKYHLDRTQAPAPEDPSLSLKEYMQAMMEKMIALYQDFEFLDRLSFFNEAGKVSPLIRAYARDRHEREVAAWREVISHAIQMGEIQSPLPDEDLARLFIGLTDGIVVNQSLQGALEQEIATKVTEGCAALYAILKK